VITQPRAEVRTVIHYLVPSSRINRRFWAPGAELNTGTYAPYPVTIRNARLAPEPFTLDRHGFCLARHDTKVTDWRDAAWCERHGLYARVSDDVDAMDSALGLLAGALRVSNPAAMSEMKRTFWQGTEHWESLLTARARVSGALVLSDYTRAAIERFRKR